MNILIIEDEIEATKNLLWLLNKTLPDATILATIDAVSEGIQWLKTNPMPDLIISDIQLADGNSFEIFEQVKVSCPVIFATAFDEYALKAFEVHSIDYLLKPIDLKQMERAINKFNSLNINSIEKYSENISTLIKSSINSQKQYRQSFLVRYREKMLPIKTEFFAYFYTKEGLVYGKTNDDKTYNIELTLEELDLQLPPSVFFRANRQYIISREAVIEIEFYFNGRLLLKTKPHSSENILISKERVPVFKKWFEAI